MNLFTIELCAEDRARVDRLIEVLERRSCDKCVSSALAYKEAVQAEVQQKAPEAPVEVPAPASAPVPEVSLPEFQKAVTLRCAESAVTKAKVKDLLNQYAPSVSLVPANKRAEVLEKLSQIPVFKEVTK